VLRFFPFHEIKNDWLNFLCVMRYARVCAPHLNVVNMHNINRINICIKKIIGYDELLGK